MIKEKDLQELRPQVQCKNGKDITLQSVQRTLQNLMEEHGIVAAFYTEQVKCGGLLGTTDNCLVLYHPEHQNDYFSIAIRVKQEKFSATLVVNCFGVSKLMNAEVVRKQFNIAAKEGINYRGYNPLQNAAAGASLIAVGVAGIHHLANKEKFEEEQRWYSVICSLFDEATF